MGSFLIKEVFLVEDDDIVKMVTKKILKSIGFEQTISQFENGKTALNEIKRRISEQTFDQTTLPVLILLDINMPVMDGWEFLEQFSKLNQASKGHFLIVILTSSIDSSDRNLAFSYPDVNEFISKPLSGNLVIDFLSKQGLYKD